MSILIEGPDGAGKSSLACDLQAHFPEMEMHPRFCTSKEGPIAELATAVYKDTRGLPTHYIYDRHPIISDYVYNASIPSRRFSADFLSETMARVRDRIAYSSLVIWCLPPFRTVADNVLRDEDDQMPGVAQNIHKIYDNYQMHRLMWPGPSALFDYTKSEDSWKHLMFVLNDTKGKLWLPSPK